MKKYGYIYVEDPEHFEEKKRILEGYDCDEILVVQYDEDDKDAAEKRKSVVDRLAEGDELVICNVEWLNSTLISLCDLINEVEAKGARLKILSGAFAETSYEIYSQMIKSLTVMEKNKIVDRTNKGLARARKEGRIGGRPKISEKKVKAIRKHYYKDKMTVKDVSNKTGVSIGTVFKYIKNIPDEELKKLQ